MLGSGGLRRRLKEVLEVRDFLVLLYLRFARPERPSRLLRTDGRLVHNLDVMSV
jgi:hypothetical protein